jgi:hypothetical protein
MFQYKIDDTLSTKWYLTVLSACDAMYLELAKPANHCPWGKIVNVRV